MKITKYTEIRGFCIKLIWVLLLNNKKCLSCTIEYQESIKIVSSAEHNLHFFAKNRHLQQWQQQNAFYIARTIIVCHVIVIESTLISIGVLIIFELHSLHFKCALHNNVFMGETYSILDIHCMETKIAKRKYFTSQLQWQWHGDLRHRTNNLFLKGVHLHSIFVGRIVETREYLRKRMPNKMCMKCVEKLKICEYTPLEKRMGDKQKMECSWKNLLSSSR